MLTAHDPELRRYYKAYSKILAEVIKQSKKLHFNQLLLNQRIGKNNAEFCKNRNQQTRYL